MKTIQSLNEYLNLSPQSFDKLILTVAIFIFLSLGKILCDVIIRKKFSETRSVYRWRRATLYTYTILLSLIIGSIWARGIANLTTFLGLASAGIAIAMHDTIANMAGWVFIISRKPFKVGDRIEIGKSAGDVIDVRIFEFSIVEIGNWVDADQSTGRIIHIPNSKVLREPLANYHIGFEYIWNEIPVLITFESDWKRAKEILQQVASEHVEHLSQGVQEQIRSAAKKYFIFYGTLTPIVYTTVKDSGVLLTIRYLVSPRQRRSTEQNVWESILDLFAQENNIELAYPTVRFYHENPPHDHSSPGYRSQRSDMK
ncbi:MAG: mechanosensitive ion channel family protein [SAR324 cluster bacterium]|nr:mechanosensitive ion channel family protein [SAR324 cluster bacterium]